MGTKATRSHHRRSVAVRRSRRRRRGGLGVLLVAAVAVVAALLAATGRDNDSGQAVSRFVDIHGMAAPAWSPQVHVATHHGLIRRDPDGI